LIAVTLQLGLMFAQALATPWDFASHVSLTLNRLPHQLAPAAGFLAVMVLAGVLGWRVASGESSSQPATRNSQLPKTDP